MLKTHLADHPKPLLTFAPRASIYRIYRDNSMNLSIIIYKTWTVLGSKEQPCKKETPKKKTSFWKNTNQNLIHLQRILQVGTVQILGVSTQQLAPGRSGSQQLVSGRPSHGQGQGGCNSHLLQPAASCEGWVVGSKSPSWVSDRFFVQQECAHVGWCW